MDSRLLEVSGSHLEDIRLEEPIVLSSMEVSEAIMDGENIWK